MTRGRVAWSLALLALYAGGCSESSRPEVVDVGDGAELLLLVPTNVRSEDRGNVALRLPSGSVVTVQHVAAYSEEERETRTATSVAEALVTRVELGEGEGQLAQRACSRGQLVGRCVDGWMRVGERRFERRGLIFATSSRIVWLDVARTTDDADAIADEASTIMTGAVLTDPGQPEAPVE